MIKLAIFDMDGVLTETSHYHYLAWKALADDLGIVIDEAFNEELKGVSRKESLIRILEHGNQLNKCSEDEIGRLMTQKNDHYRQLIEAVTPNDLFEGVIEIFQLLKKNNIRIAVGSASRNAPFLIERLGIKSYIDYVVDPSQVRGKPEPDIFLDAAAFFNLSSEDCIGIEDAKAGVEAINSAGMLSIGIGDAEVLKDADYAYNSTKDSYSYFETLTLVR
ncbi:MAG: beta-phosphoglucomutase [Clostridiales bacterium]|nr:beta-phosphoglucomutase [Clostridiales bacterium]